MGFFGLNCNYVVNMQHKNCVRILENCFT
jgi:hypothetical protein